jgi:quinol monooxygenase YgiN
MIKRIAQSAQKSATFTPRSLPAKTAWFVFLLTLLLLSSCVSKNLRQARQMMAKGRFDEACHWYDETISELVPNNSLILERFKAYRAACESHISATYAKLSSGNLSEAVTEAEAANRYAGEVPDLVTEAEKPLSACASTYGRRAQDSPLKSRFR